jgi:hypothetical protein
MTQKVPKEITTDRIKIITYKSIKGETLKLFYLAKASIVHLGVAQVLYLKMAPSFHYQYQLLRKI